MLIPKKPSVDEGVLTHMSKACVVLVWVKAAFPPRRPETIPTVNIASIAPLAAKKDDAQWRVYRFVWSIPRDLTTMSVEYEEW